MSASALTPDEAQNLARCESAIEAAIVAVGQEMLTHEHGTLSANAAEMKGISR